MDTVGGYELAACIGVGASGTVWRARRLGPLAQQVALKRAIVRRGPDAARVREMLRDEATNLADLDHPHIVDVLDVFDDDGSVAIVMQLARGGSLQALLDSRQSLAAGEVAAIMAPVADALASAHRRGIVHGDVKPANILFTSDGEPLLSDFGAARHLGLPTATDAGFGGTVPYLDPWLLRDATPSTASDIYAVGAVCCEALCGSSGMGGPVAEAADSSAAGATYASWPIRRVPSVPEALVQLLERSISPLAHERPHTMAEFSAELRASVDPAMVRLPAVAGSAAAAAVASATASGAGEGRQGAPAIGSVRTATVERSSAPAGARHHTQQFGPRPPMPREKEQRRRGPSMVVALLCCAAVVVAGAVWLIRDNRAASTHRPTASAPRRARAGRVEECRGFPPLDVAKGAKRFEVDLNGDGCAVPVTWDGSVLAARFAPNERTPRYYQIGARGDRLLFGDWNCDGAQSPALYRPALGEVMYVNRFARRVGDTSPADRITRDLPRGGTAHVVTGRDGCETVRVTEPAGAGRTAGRNGDRSG